jgi:ABC-type Mn2+/Zn2+ transport system ATPase subunit
LSSYKAFNWGIPLYNKGLYRKLDEILEIIGAHDYVNKPFMTLSGGQKKRIFLAQALINESKLLLMDEPLADLDPESKQSFLQSLRKIHKETTLSLMMISHDMHEITEYLNAFIHFKDSKVHLCKELPCIKESAYVGV